jgi:hypothetical protein
LYQDKKNTEINYEIEIKLIKEIEQAMKNGTLSSLKTTTRQQGSSLSLRMTKRNGMLSDVKSQ